MNLMKPNVDRNRFPASVTSLPARQRRDADPDWAAAVGIHDAGNEYLFEFDLPGRNQEQIQISLDEDALLLVGTRISAEPGEMSRWDERPVGAFVRRLVLPPDSRGDEIYATLAEGVLQLHVPKDTPYQEKQASHTIQSEEQDYEYTH